MVGPSPALADLLRAAEHILVFTGAGVSTASGIRDFRGPQGVWKTRSPVYFHQFLSSEQSRVEYWDQKLEAWASFRDAAPNAVHTAIVDLETFGKLDTLVTQNIDGLHRMAGTSPGRLVEIHGTNAEVECVSCGRRSDPERAFAAFQRSRVPPRCGCGGLLKTATISFGQDLRPDDLDRAFAAAERADLVVALGSTLSVHPAASVPLSAARRGVPYVVINRGPTDHDGAAFVTLRLEGDVVDCFPPAVAAALRPGP